MSKQSDAKERQQYTPKFVAGTCGNCANYRSEFEEKQYKSFAGLQVWTVEKDKRCGIGGFAIKKTGSCAEWAGVAAEATP